MWYSRAQTPIGGLLIVGDDAGLRRVDFIGGRNGVAVEPDWIEDDATAGEAIAQLRAYFAGELREFDLPLAPVGTAFQLKCWSALRAIPYGRTISYGEQARRLGDANAARAVGAANGANPIAIVVPCHRVIGASGSLVGYGGGLDVKRALLEHEAAHVGLFADAHAD